MDVGWIYFDLRLQNLKEQDYSSLHNMAVQLCIRNYYVMYDCEDGGSTIKPWFSLHYNNWVSRSYGILDFAFG